MTYLSRLKWWGEWSSAWRVIGWAHTLKHDNAFQGEAVGLIAVMLVRLENVEQRVTSPLGWLP